MQSALLIPRTAGVSHLHASTSGRHSLVTASRACQLQHRYNTAWPRLYAVKRCHSSQTHRSHTICFAAPASVPEQHNDISAALKPLPRAVENVADDPSLHNPLQRLHRLGPGWMGVILEYEGVLVDDTSDLHSKAWQALGQEEGKPRPLHWALKRAEGMKSEQVRNACLHCKGL